MIYGLIEELSNYKGLSNNLDKVIDFIGDNDINMLPLGRTDISGDDIYVNVVESDLSDPLDVQFEFHKKYLDLHIDIVGRERILFSDKNIFTIEHEYEEDADYSLGEGSTIAECIIDKNHFCICLINEPHKPCVKITSENKTKKAIFKIRTDKLC